MKNIRLLLIVFIVLIFHITVLKANQSIKKEAKKRFALVVGANNGGFDRILLKYAVSDAKSLIKVLEDMGGVARDDCILLEDPKREMFFSEVKNLQQRVNKARSEYRRVEVIFYYSGHSDEKNILIGEEKISYKEFRDTINMIKADIRIAILDSCASGAFTRIKGGKKRSPFLIDTAYDMKGSAFMTSSSSDEASQESDRLKGSFFTHYLISGMRGAADMTQDGRITLSEAYQYAFSETLSQTQKTLSGPQHPNYNIQMTGTGDVVMTDIRKSSAVLVVGKNIFGRIFIHNQENVLVVELNKPYGRHIEIGLEQGKYRIINIREGKVYESKITLLESKRVRLKIDQLKETERMDTIARGKKPLQSSKEKMQKTKDRFQIELFGGFSTLNPADLNLRTQVDTKFEEYYYDAYFTFQRNNGDISFYTKNLQGERKEIKYALPFGFRFKYFFNKSIAISLGFEYIKKNQSSDIWNQYTIIKDSEEQYIYDRKISPYKISIEGYIPSLGIHYGKKINGSIEIEGFVTGGPLFANCNYLIDYEAGPVSDTGVILDRYEWKESKLEEKGKGTGFALNGGIRMNIDIGKSFGLFLEGAYAYQVVNKISGPGSRIYSSATYTWEGDWGIKEENVNRDWGSCHFLWPSNYWEEGEIDLKIRDFQLDLSGFRIRIGISYRF